MSRIRDLLVSASLVNQGEMVSYVPCVKHCEGGMYRQVDLNTIKIQSQTRAGAIVLFFDYIYKNATPTWRKPQFVDLYECIDEDIKELEECWKRDNTPVRDADRLEYIINSMFEYHNYEVWLEREKIVLSN